MIKLTSPNSIDNVDIVRLKTFYTGGSNLGSDSYVCVNFSWCKKKG